MKPTEQDWETMVFCQRIAHAVRRSDNLRVPRNPEGALSDMIRAIDGQQESEGLSYRRVSVKGQFGGQYFKRERNKSLIDFVAAGNTRKEAAKFFGISDSRVGQILKRGY